MGSEFKIFACEVMKAELLRLIDRLDRADRFEIEWFEMGLHEKPEKLNAELRRRLADTEGKGYRAILLLFGLCSNATAGLSPPADSLLVIPRVHDCVSLYLGSAKQYLAEHAAESGTYWFSRGFLHRADGGSPDLSGLGIGLGSLFLDHDGKAVGRTAIREKFVEDYGEENAGYLMETLIESWKKNYTRAVYLRWPDNPLLDEDMAFVRRYAEDNGWRFETRDVDLRLLGALIGGAWHSDEFAVVRPGERLAPTHGDDAIRVEPIGAADRCAGISECM